MTDKPLIIILSSKKEQDQSLELEFLQHLETAGRRIELSCWATSRLGAGDDADEQLQKTLPRAQALVCLLSIDFWAEWPDQKLAPIICAFQQTDRRVIPIRLRACDPGAFRTKRIVPDKALVEENGRDQRMAEVADAIVRDLTPPPESIQPQQRVEITASPLTSFAKGARSSSAPDCTRGRLRPGSWSMVMVAGATAALLVVTFFWRVWSNRREASCPVHTWGLCLGLQALRDIVPEAKIQLESNCKGDGFWSLLQGAKVQGSCKAAILGSANQLVDHSDLVGLEYLQQQCDKSMGHSDSCIIAGRMLWAQKKYNEACENYCKSCRNDKRFCLVFQNSEIRVQGQNETRNPFKQCEKIIEKGSCGITKYNFAKFYKDRCDLENEPYSCFQYALIQESEGPPALYDEYHKRACASADELAQFQVNCARSAKSDPLDKNCNVAWAQACGRWGHRARKTMNVKAELCKACSTDCGDDCLQACIDLIELGAINASAISEECSKLLLHQ